MSQHPEADGPSPKNSGVDKADLAVFCNRYIRWQNRIIQPLFLNK